MRELAFYLGIVGVTCICLGFLWNLKKGILATCLFKPLIDATWDHGIRGITLLHVVGVVVPGIVLLAVAKNGSTTKLLKNRWQQLAYLYFAANCIGIPSLFVHQDPLVPIDLALRSLNGLAAFFMFPLFFRQQADFKQLLLSVQIGCLFPLAIGIIQATTGAQWVTGQVEGISRNVGLYHDIVTLRHYGFFALISAALYAAYFRPKGIQLFLIIAYCIGWTIVIYNVHSKAAVVTLLLWFLIWSFKVRKTWLILGAFLLSLVLIVNYKAVVESTAVNRIARIFWKEVALSEGNLHDQRRILQGRGYIWDEAFKSWDALPLFWKLVGAGENKGVHNEFLRILITHGILGLTAFVVFAAVIGFDTVQMVTRPNPSVLDVGASMIAAMWIVDCMGLHPGLYPTFQWYAWGFIGLSSLGQNIPWARQSPSYSRYAHPRSHSEYQL